MVRNGKRGMVSSGKKGMVRNGKRRMWKTRYLKWQTVN